MRLAFRPQLCFPPLSFLPPYRVDSVVFPRAWKEARERPFQSQALIVSEALIVKVLFLVVIHSKGRLPADRKSQDYSCAFFSVRLFETSPASTRRKLLRAVRSEDACLERMDLRERGLVSICSVSEAPLGTISHGRTRPGMDLFCDNSFRNSNIIRGVHFAKLGNSAHVLVQTDLQLSAFPSFQSPVELSTRVLSKRPGLSKCAAATKDS
jgi:hypothetical protein